MTEELTPFPEPHHAHPDDWKTELKQAACVAYDAVDELEKCRPGRQPLLMKAAAKLPLLICEMLECDKGYLMAEALVTSKLNILNCRPMKNSTSDRDPAQALMPPLPGLLPVRPLV